MRSGLLARLAAAMIGGPEVKSWAGWALGMAIAEATAKAGRRRKTRRRKWRNAE